MSELAGARRPSLRRVLNATGVLVHTNLGRAPLAAAALERVAEVGARLLEPRVRPRARRARVAAGSPRVAARSSHRRRGGARRQQQRCRGPARARGARRGPRGRRLPRRADRDRRRFPHPRRPRALRRAARRGGDDEPHTGGGLRARHRAGDGGAASRAPVELPGRRVLGAASARGACGDRAAARGAARGRPRLGRAVAGRRRADAEREPGGGRRRRLLLRRQAPRRPAGRGRRRARRARRAAAPASAAARAPGRQAHARCARGDARRGALDRRRAARCPCCGCSTSRSRPFEPGPSGSPELVGGEVEETVARVGGGALPLAELPSAACAVEEMLAEPLRLGEPPVIGVVRDGGCCSTAGR